jgi:hypothetical protein
MDDDIYSIVALKMWLILDMFNITNGKGENIPILHPAGLY